MDHSELKQKNSIGFVTILIHEKGFGSHPNKNSRVVVSKVIHVSIQQCPGNLYNNTGIMCISTYLAIGSFQQYGEGSLLYG